MFKIKKWISNKTKENNLYELWKTLGAFSGKDESRNILFTKKTEELAAYMSINNSYSDIITNIVFVIVVKAYFAHDYIFSSCSNVVKFVESNKFMIDRIAADDPKVDAEAEFCLEMAKSITNLKL